jgi:SAM-dependent methyltransferase
MLAAQLATRFTHVTGLDPEASMVDAGLHPEGTDITYGVGVAEELGAAGIKDDSADLVIAGEAAHYFDHARAWPEIARVLRPNGTVAYIGYGRISFPGHEDANAAIAQLMDGDLNGCWSEPGWSISEGLYDRIPFPVAPAAPALDGLPDLSGGGHPLAAEIAEPAATGPEDAWDAHSAVRLKSGTTAGNWFLRETWDLHQIERIIRSWSAVKRYQDRNPADKEATPDVVGRTIAQLKPVFGDAPVEVAWPLVVLLIRRK